MVYRQCPDGNITGISARIIARAAQWDDDPEIFTDALLQVGLLDKAEDGTTTIHDWWDYAGKLIDRRTVRTETANEHAGRTLIRPEDVRNVVQLSDGTVPNSTQPNSTQENARRAVRRFRSPQNPKNHLRKRWSSQRALPRRKPYPNLSLTRPSELSTDASRTRAPEEYSRQAKAVQSLCLAGATEPEIEKAWHQRSATMGAANG